MYKLMKDNIFKFCLPTAPASKHPKILKKPIKAIDNAPNPSMELQTKLIRLPFMIGLLASTIKAGKMSGNKS